MKTKGATKKAVKQIEKQLIQIQTKRDDWCRLNPLADLETAWLQGYWQGRRDMLTELRHDFKEAK